MGGSFVSLYYPCSWSNCLVCLVDPDRQCIWVVGISSLLLAPFSSGCISRYNPAVHVCSPQPDLSRAKTQADRCPGTQHSPLQRAHSPLYAPLAWCCYLSVSLKTKNSTWVWLRIGRVVDCIEGWLSTFLMF